MLVTIAIMGCRCRKEASLSSASATRYRPAPSRALLAALLSRPPITKVGSSPPSARMLATRLVVVVLPCVPATAIDWRKRISSPSISARGTTGTRREQCRLHFRIVAGDGAGGHDYIGAVRIGSAMSEPDARAEPLQVLGHRVGLEVRALHPVAQVQQHFGDAAHAAAADADEMNRVDAAHALAHAATPASCAQASASSVVALVRARSRARSAMAMSRPRPAHSASSSADRRSAVRSRSLIRSAAPSLTRKRALCVW